MSQKIDLLNIVLIVISFFLALVLPVRLFLFSYAILGPLHYLTEIGWLDKRGYFTKKKSDVWILAVLCGILTIGFFMAQLASTDPLIQDTTTSWTQYLSSVFNNIGGGIVFFAFAVGLALVFIKKSIVRYSVIVVAGVLSLFVHMIEPVFIIFGIFVPTIIHVSIFTAFFMLYGALKNKSIAGYVSVFLFCAGCVLIFRIDLSPALIKADSGSFQMLLDSTFVHIGASLSQFLGLQPKGSDYLLLSTIGLQMQMLFSFCYTYHYLNWFSKTKIINWHEVSRRWLIFTGIIWLASILLYTIDYKIGFLALFFLSMLHVFFEFPLNGLSVVGVFQELKNRLLK